MNSAEQTVTWLITLGVLESPKKTISDPEGFLQSSLKDGVVLCRLLERLRPGTVDKVFQEPRSDSECQSNISGFVRGCAAFYVEPFEVSDLHQGVNFSKVLNCLLALNKATEVTGAGGDGVGVRQSCSLRIKSFDSLNAQGRSSKVLQPQYRSLDMSEGSGCGHVLVKARFAFQRTNEDELSFSKGDIISVTRQEEGGWWEGSLNGQSGWFPSNYVREVKGNDKPVSPKSATLKSPLKGFDSTIVSKTYYNVVLQNIFETESEYSRELQSLLASYLRSLHPTDNVSGADISHIQGNLEEVSTFQQMLVQSLEERTKLPEYQQRIGGFFLGLMPQMKTLYMAYCSNHPSAVHVLTQHSEELGEYMESKGAPSPGILNLTTGLSKPFTRLDRYPTLLKELDRHMEDHHPDRPDLHTSMTAFKTLSVQCQEVRKRKELELQILTEPIRNWEGDDIKTLGPVLHMALTTVYTHSCQEKSERYLLLFPHTLLMVSPSSRMSGFIYQGRLPLSGMLISRIEDGDNLRNAFEISGGQCERMQVACGSPQDLQDWLDLLTKHTHTLSSHTPAPATHTAKPLSAYQTLPSQPATPSRHLESCGGGGGPAYHTLPHNSSFGAVPGVSPMWGPLEPPNTPKPWSLSCLRPAPPLRPSAALCYKEDKSPKSVKKLLPKRKPERKPSEEDFSTRKSTAALEEDAQILKVIEAYCTSAKTRQTLNSSSSRKDVHILFPEKEKIIVEEIKSNGQTVVEEMSLVDTVYSLKDELQELKQDNKRMRRTLEEEQRARKELERIIRRVLKNMNDPTWDETNL
ncbi:rho guanine nucleotide exchange factor 7b isoform X1 [Lampris incognitus]|uniref:rho guanine nucleotide exchange factor 7b isoform X1 n=1 Tax=Lampris incognitus TaxID=2546036 RepID=UPI0024B62E48|nr:rho guanine nucleotide exchange factor 7b isoform X1 [Lampris incognitus]